jgi:hypothetical protein
MTIVIVIHLAKKSKEQKFIGKHLVISTISIIFANEIKKQNFKLWI